MTHSEIASSYLQELMVQSCVSKNASYKMLPGDASNRRYARVSDGSKNYILMIMNEREAFKSEEASSAGVQSAELDFVSIGRDWKKQGIRVPEIFYVDSSSRFIFLEDFGDELLYDLRQKQGAIEFYEKALEELVKIQSLEACSVISQRSFNKELLFWELEHFFEYALEKRGIHIAAEDEKSLRAFFEEAVQAISSVEQVVTHRDFHSKNLIVFQNEIGVIDFQDALIGPPTYDLASLLRDSYVRLEPNEERRLLDFYKERAGSLDEKVYALTSIQRNMKAVGRFFYISMVKGKDTHLPYVAPTCKRIYKSLEDLGALSMKKLLESKLGNS